VSERSSGAGASRQDIDAVRRISRDGDAGSFNTGAMAHRSANQCGERSMKTTQLKVNLGAMLGAALFLAAQVAAIDTMASQRTLAKGVPIVQLERVVVTGQREPQAWQRAIAGARSDKSRAG